MDTVIRNPGLHHLVEKVFWNLDAENLKICAEINQSCKQILQNPIFCLRKFEHLSKENQKDWIKVLYNFAIAVKINTFEHRYHVLEITRPHQL